MEIFCYRTAISIFREFGIDHSELKEEWKTVHARRCSHTEVLHKAVFTHPLTGDRMFIEEHSWGHNGVDPDHIEVAIYPIDDRPFLPETIEY